MEKLKVCFVGIGSIAKRHIRNLSEICAQRGIDLTVDAFRSSDSQEHVKGVAQQYHLLESMPRDYDVIFITNPTELHLNTLTHFHNRAKHFFIEKPLVSTRQIPDALRFQKREGSVYYVACPLRYNAVIQYIKERFDPADILSVRSISSSYLPDWRPGKDYRDTYSAHKDLGGGVSIDLIHEWDYLTYLFGMPDRVLCMIGKKSSLEIDSDDYAVYIAEAKDRIFELHLDYFGRKPIREIQLFTRNDTVVGDLVNNRIAWLKGERTIDFNEDRDAYQKRELEHFINLISGELEPTDDYARAIEVLNLTRGIIRRPQ